mmetsp:Transcript_57363/g.158776  ORF Transcript_57363/g.158776 Transcript_57363/m.158776 type:complete len:230 (+) Transcript_57363:908-1597(+)
MRSALRQSCKDLLNDATLAQLHPQVRVRCQITEDTTCLLKKYDVVAKGAHGHDSFVYETKVHNVLPVLRVAAETADDAQGGLVEAAIAHVCLQHRRQGREPPGSEQRMLNLGAVLRAGPDGGGDIRTGARRHRVVEGGHERVHAAVLQHSQAAVLLDGEVAQETAHGHDQRHAPDAPFQHVDHQRDAAAVLDPAPVPRALGHERQGGDAVLHDTVVVAVLPEQVDDCRN